MTQDISPDISPASASTCGDDAAPIASDVDEASAPIASDVDEASAPIASDVDEASAKADAPSPMQWFVLRDLKRPNAKTPAYKELGSRGFEVFTPMHWKVSVVRGKRKRFQVPVLGDLLFVHSSRAALDPVIDVTSTLQYRYVRGGYCKPMVVSDYEMERFIIATTRSVDPELYAIADVEKLSIGKSIKIVGGALEGVEGRIVNVRGARKKRILVSIPDLIAAVVEVEPEYVVINE